MQEAAVMMLAVEFQSFEAGVVCQNAFFRARVLPANPPNTCLAVRVESNWAGAVGTLFTLL